MKDNNGLSPFKAGKWNHHWCSGMPIIAKGYATCIRTLLLGLIIAACCAPQTIPEIRYKLSAGDLTSADAIADEFCNASGATSECADAVAWLARGAFYLHESGRSRVYLDQAKVLTAKVSAKTRPEDDAYLAAAIGAELEIEAQLLVQEGHREKAIQLLSDALPHWELWSIKARIQKNLNLLTLVGQPSPLLPANVRGKPVLFFLWGHWCSDCTGQAPILARLHKRFPGLAMIAPTRRIGQVGDNDHASAEQEDAQIEKVWKESYPGLSDIPHPVEPAIQMAYGVSSTPTLVLVDRTGIVRLYCPFRMSESELAKSIMPMLSQ